MLSMLCERQIVLQTMGLFNQGCPGVVLYGKSRQWSLKVSFTVVWGKAV